MKQVRIFLSSPGDVAEERKKVREALQGLQQLPFVRGKIAIDVVSWDDPHAPATMDARLTPQQAVNASLPTPADCDVTIVILWSRIGTPLTDEKDGTLYRSGTEWEYWNAINAKKPVYLFAAQLQYGPIWPIHSTRNKWRNTAASSPSSTR